MATTAYPVNPTLSAIAIGYRNPEVTLIADQVLPRVPHGLKFTYTKYTASDAYTIPDTRVGRKSEPSQVDFSGTAVTDECLDEGLDHFVPNREIQAFDDMPKPTAGGPLSPRERATVLLTSLIQLRREVRTSALVFAAGTYATANKTTLSGNTQWSDYTNSDPITAIEAGLDVPLIRPNTLVLGQAVWTKLRSHPDIVNAIRGNVTGSGAVRREEVAELFELRQVLVGSSFVNTAKKGQTPSYSRTWGKYAALLLVSENAAMNDQPTFGFTAQFGDRVATDIPAPEIGLHGGVKVRVGESVKEVISAADLGYLFIDAVA